MMERRTFLAALGLAPAAFGTEAFTGEIPKGDIATSESVGVEQIAAALEALAREIRADNVSPVSITIDSKIAPQMAIEHVFSIRLFYNPNGMSK